MGSSVRPAALSAIGILVICLAIFTGFSQEAGGRTLGSNTRPAPRSSSISLAGLDRVLGSESSQGHSPGHAAASESDHGVAVAPSAGDACAGAPHFGWLHTAGVWIEDDQNCKVRLIGATWYGMQTTYYVPAGLDFQPYTTILSEIKSLGFNSIRVPISDQLVRDNAKITIGADCGNDPKTCYVLKDPELIGKHPLAVLSLLINAARRAGLFVILDNHFSAARTPQSYNKSVSIRGVKRHEATWASQGWTESGWIHDWVTLAKRYRLNPTVIGFDLRNKPHTNGPGPWSMKTYLTKGATWGPSPSKLWQPATDWAAAARKCGNTVLAVNPHLLMFVEGVQLYPDPTQRRGVESYWWGSILRGVAVDPVVFRVPHQLVYSPHEWGPWKFNSGVFTYRTTYSMMAKIFNQNWGFILKSTNPAIRNPIWLGEFNTCNTNETCVNSTERGSQGQWFQILLRYLHNNPEISWDYYPINGTNSFDERSNNSVLNKKWKHPKLGSLMTALRQDMTQPKQ